MRKGFTLLELLTVVIIVAILAVIAIPQYFKAAERARATEAVNLLGMIRRAQIRYYAEQAKTTGDCSDLDVDIPDLKYFSSLKCIELSETKGNPYMGTGGTQELANIERNDEQNPGYGNYKLHIYENGEVRCSPNGGKCPPGFAIAK